ncbi:MAG TPA: ATP-binding protein [Methylomirabilota bacterium]|nr:ATP-binding protein [Methylomirabilota bacterium]
MTGGATGDSELEAAEALAQVSAALAESLDPAIVVSRVAASVRQLLRCQGATVYRVEDATGTLVLEGVSGLDQDWSVGLRLPKGLGITAVALRAGHPIASDDVLQDPAIFLDAPMRARLAALDHRAMMSAPLLSRGRIVGAITVADLPGRRFTERELRHMKMFADMAAIALTNAQQYRAEERLRADAEAANRAKDDFLAMLGHELRNPLAAIGNAAHVLDRVGTVDEAAARASAVIHRQVRHLAGLVDDLLDAARVSTGKIVLRMAPVDLGAAVTRMISSLGAPRQRVRVDVESVWVTADETRLDQIIGNLVANAREYTPAAGEVRIRVRGEGGDAVLEIEDTGDGIPAALLPHVFEPFVQGERSPDRRHGGLGLGLALVKRLAEMHGGSVAAASGGIGRGSTFTVRLPRASAPVSSTTPAPPAGGTAPRRVLIVEDNTDAREVLRLALTLDGHQVHEAADGAEGVEAALRLAPDAALIDVGLPTLDGYAVARQIRAAERRTRMLLVALTGYGQAEDRRRALEAGFDVHLVKPVTPERLTEVLQRAPIATRRS